VNAAEECFAGQDMEQELEAAGQVAGQDECLSTIIGGVTTSTDVFTRRLRRWARCCARWWRWRALNTRSSAERGCMSRMRRCSYPRCSRSSSRRRPRRPGAGAGSLRAKAPCSLRRSKRIFCAASGRDNKVTAYLLKENMDKEFRGREELQLMEEDVSQWLGAWYSKQPRGKGKVGAEEEQEGDEAA